MAFPLWALTSICPDLLAFKTLGTVQQKTKGSSLSGLSFEASGCSSTALLHCVQSDQALSITRLLTALLIISQKCLC